MNTTTKTDCMQTAIKPLVTCQTINRVTGKPCGETRRRQLVEVELPSGETRVLCRPHAFGWVRENMRMATDAGLEFQPVGHTEPEETCAVCAD